MASEDLTHVLGAFGESRGEKWLALTYALVNGVLLGECAQRLSNDEWVYFLQFYNNAHNAHGIVTPHTSVEGIRKCVFDQFDEIDAYANMVRGQINGQE